MDCADPAFDDFFDQVEVDFLVSHGEDGTVIHVFAICPELPLLPDEEEESAA